MPRDEMSCPKCRGAMQEGFVCDHSYGARLVSIWVEGAPERSLLSGVKLKGRATIEMQIYRCTKCGFLEAYAH